MDGTESDDGGHCVVDSSGCGTNQHLPSDQQQLLVGRHIQAARWTEQTLVNSFFFHCKQPPHTPPSPPSLRVCHHPFTRALIPVLSRSYSILGDSSVAFHLFSLLPTEEVTRLRQQMARTQFEVRRLSYIHDSNEVLPFVVLSRPNRNPLPHANCPSLSTLVHSV